MNFKMTNCDFGWNYNDVKYDFDHVESVTIEDPEMVTLVRGSNKKNKEGIVITQGGKDPKVVTVVLIGISKTLFDAFKACWDAQARSECWIVDRSDGSARFVKQAIISKQPRQLSIGEDPDNLNVTVEFHSFDIQEDHKS